MTETSADRFIGLDAGGTATRWAVVRSDGTLQSQGQGAGLSGLMLLSADGRAALDGALRAIAAEAGPVAGVCAGVTGFDGDAAGPLAQAVASALTLEPRQVLLYNDIELACRAAFAPGEGHLVYAGTGSVAAHIDAEGTQHRAGGRGGLIDDGGSGYWIAREALRRVWRREDETPGAWRQSALAQHLFEHVGGSDWAASRSFVYGASRGQLGELAVAVAAAAHAGDGEALDLLREAGIELARLGRALVRRCGARPIRLAGRVFQLHPVIEVRLREALAGLEVQAPGELQAHVAAARLAAEAAR